MRRRGGHKFIYRCFEHFVFIFLNLTPVSKKSCGSYKGNKGNCLYSDVRFHAMQKPFKLLALIITNKLNP